MKNLDYPKYREYSERYGFWQNVSLNQLSFSNNLFLVTAFTAIGFIYKQMPQSGYHVDVYNADGNLTLTAIAMIIFSISIALGIFCVLTRLVDFRITRNIALTRQRFFNYYSGEKISEEKTETGYLKETRVKKEGKFFYILLCSKSLLIENDDIPKNKKNHCITELKRQINSRIENLSYWSDNFGKWSWRFHYWQVVSFLIACVFFVSSCF